MSLSSSPSINTRPTVEEIDAAGTPSLVGYWKCDEGGGEVLHDSSGNGYHLNYGDGAEPGFGQSPKVDSFPVVTAAEMWNRKPGYLTPLGGYGFYRDIAGTLLDTGTNYAILCAEIFVTDDTSIGLDFDAGWYWAGRRTTDALPDNFPQPYGLNIGQVGDTIWIRFAWDDANTTKSDIVYPTLAYNLKPYSTLVSGEGLGDTDWAIAGAYVPGTEVRATAKHDLTVSTFGAVGAETFPASMGAQGDIFGVRGQTGFTKAAGIRHIQAWSFAAEPPYLNETLIWLSANPGRIPPWWVGR